MIVFWHSMVSGQSIESFSLPNSINDSNFSLSTYKSDKAVVIIFYSGKCAYGDHYFERIISIKDEFSAKGVKFILINANSSAYVPEESLKEMKNFAEKSNLNIPYLADKDKMVKNMLKATRTPEAFVLKPSQGQFSVVYKGAIDDNPQSAGDVSHTYLQDALFNLLNNSKIEFPQTRPVGCLIK